MSREQQSPPTGALVQADQPWGDAELAQLYDSFPFSDDLPFYLELAERQGDEVLELCCGSGRVLLPLARAGHRLVSSPLRLVPTDFRPPREAEPDPPVGAPPAGEAKARPPGSRRPGAVAGSAPAEGRRS